ncbi:phosphomannomutase/phosphoglucomutase [Halofilum ochraceum]|uniref:phosphomannomutase/phosphoglucomutase n=1 Tax=Halofilum ochraceum TaxID=1611323 RepID=UPI0008D9874E|nr:phosphomannomutase/phosphoglucomutase [Halofilum ochraceum]
MTDALPAVAPSLFRAYDIRGVVGDTLTRASVHAIARAFAAEAAARDQYRVVIGRDGRLSGPDLLSALREGLIAGGMHVIDIGPVPTPVLYYATVALETGTGIVLTGSHNPPDYNGLKMMIGGDTLSGDAIQALRQRIESGDVASGNGSAEEIDDFTDTYLAQVFGDIHLKRPLRIAIDCGNGITGAVAPQLYEGLGCEVHALYAEVDGTFPNHHPDPSKPENLSDLIACVRENGLDLGLAFDGDGDRLGVVDGHGNVIWPDRQMILYTRAVLAERPGARIVYDVKCSSHLTRAIADAGGDGEMYKTGHSFIKGRMRERDAALGGEMSGHIFFRDRWPGFDDGLYAGARLLELLAADARAPQEVFAELPDSINTPEITIPFAEEGAHFAFMEKFAEQARFDDARSILRIDGLRVDYADGWGLARPSNTTPVIVTRFEADTQEALERIQNAFREQILAVQPDLELPF